MKIIHLIGLVLVCLLISITAQASPLKWTLTGVTLSDGGTASGSFFFDATTTAYSAVAITTTASASFAGASYTGIDPFFAPDPHVLSAVPNPNLVNFTGTPVLVLLFAGVGLTGAGGTVNISVINTVGEGIFTTSNGSQATTFRSVTAGAVTAPSPSVPEPSTLSLIAFGLAGLAITQRKRNLDERSTELR